MSEVHMNKIDAYTRGYTDRAHERDYDPGAVADTDDHYANQPIPCLAGGGQSCGIWVYCDRPHGHDGAHEGWSATIERGHAERAIWTDTAEYV